MLLSKARQPLYIFCKASFSNDFVVHYTVAMFALILLMWNAQGMDLDQLFLLESIHLVSLVVEI
jgi:hypothetical protein